MRIIAIEALDAGISTHTQLSRRPLARQTFSRIEVIRMGASAYQGDEGKTVILK
jgi:hypothetical protein